MLHKIETWTDIPKRCNLCTTSFSRYFPRCDEVVPKILVINLFIVINLVTKCQIQKWKHEYPKTQENKEYEHIMQDSDHKLHKLSHVRIESNQLHYFNWYTDKYNTHNQWHLWLLSQLHVTTLWWSYLYIWRANSPGVIVVKQNVVPIVNYVKSIKEV